jgi:phosphonate transport system permease protein
VTSSTQQEWQRHTLSQKLARQFVWIVVVAAIVTSIQSVEIIPEFLLDAPEQMKDMLQRMWPIEWSFYAKGVHETLVETLHIASLGTLLAIVMALPFGFMVASNVTKSKAINNFARLVLVSSRSVNSLVWALLFVAVFGPGALAGTMAIAFRSVGFVGKLIGEALEEAAPGPIEALVAAGANKGAQINYGYWPAIRPAFWSIVLLRWDINVRESSVLGLVGAGGVGMSLNAAIETFQWDRVALILFAIFVIVIVAEVVVSYVRTRVI